MNILNIISPASGDRPPQYAALAEHVITFAGLMVFGAWLLRTSWGRNALVDSPPRRNRIPLYLPFIVLFVWFASVPLALLIGGKLITDLPEWQAVGLGNLIYCLAGMTIGTGIIVLASRCFSGRLKGFGLDFRTIHRDLPAAFLNLLCVWPLVMLALLLVTEFGQMIKGPDFELARHEQLEMMGQYSQWPLKALIVLVAAVIAPVLEELLFRGLLQTAVRSFLSDQHVRRPAWLAIVVSSVLFALAHANPGHWPALFLLSMTMGYAYEKSGSLFRSIFVHALFNGTAVFAALSG